MRDLWVHMMAVPLLVNTRQEVPVNSSDSLLNGDLMTVCLFGLFLASHASLTDEINVDQLNSEKLLRAFGFLEKHGDRISQLGAVEVGLRILSKKPEIEPTLVALIKGIRDEDADGNASSFKLVSALFCLVDGELSRIRLFSEEPPFFRRLAAMTQASLVHRQLSEFASRY